MNYTYLNFPEVHLKVRDGHKLRGYFANKFGKDSDLFHNHDTDGKTIYRYPKIQYKVINGSPMIIGIEDGAQLIIERFLGISHLEIDGLTIPTEHKNMKSRDVTIGVESALYTYDFLTPWLALNSKNYQKFQRVDAKEQKSMLESIIIRNMQSFFSSIRYFEKQRMMVSLDLQEISVNFKNESMTGFKGKFTTNVQLPNYIGLGKSVSRGFGTILRL